LTKEFGVYGPIKDVKIVKHPETNKSKGYGFIEFENKDDFRSNRLKKY
jgi:RNA recognition motif-containing protein